MGNFDDAVRALWSVYVCENVVDASTGERCGQWVLLRREHLPRGCRKCKLSPLWRVVLPTEIEDFDRRLMRELGIRWTAADAHLGAAEQS